jgi:hypothetical protein
MYNFTVFDLPQFQISLLLVAGGVNKDRMDWPGIVCFLGSVNVKFRKYIVC